MIRKRIHRTVPHVWSKDGSLDRKRMGPLDAADGIWRAFLQDGDVSKLPLLNGTKPTVFKLQSLTVDQICTLGDLSDPETLLRRHRDIVSVGLVEVTNLPDVELQFEPYYLGRRLTKETIEALGYLELIFELGGRILQISNPDPLSVGA